MSLESIADTATQLLQITLRANVGFAELSTANDKSIFTAKEKELLQLVNHLEWIKHQQREYEYVIEKQKLEFAETNDLRTEHALARQIDTLKKELAKQVSANFVKNEAIKTVEIGKSILNSQFSDAKTNSSPEAIILNELVEERDQYVSEFLLMHQELVKVQSELSKVQLAIIARHEDNRELMKEINDAFDISKTASSSTNSEAKALQKSHKDVIAKRDIIRNVLQGLVLESGVRWTKDGHLLNIMLMIGQEL
ncbi:1815_t:CDS:2, partial [Paraglomus occultum]